MRSEPKNQHTQERGDKATERTGAGTPTQGGKKRPKTRFRAVYADFEIRPSLAFFSSGWQFAEMSTLQKPTPELLAELEKQALAFIAGMQALAQFKRANSPEYREAWAKTTAAKAAYEAAAAQLPDYLPSSS